MPLVQAVMRRVDGWSGMLGRLLRPEWETLLDAKPGPVDDGVRQVGLGSFRINR
jgi:hypothetical protein